jgi:alkylhydroperoxidase family enzyme
VDINSAVGRKAGLTADKLLALTRFDLSPVDDPSLRDNASLRDTPSPFTRDELLVIELADAMVATPSNISDDLYTRLRAKFSEEQLLQLSAQLAWENYRARLNRVFDVGSDELYKPEGSNSKPNVPAP